MSIVVREYEVSDLETCRELWRSLNQRHREIYDDPTIGGSDPGLEFDEHLADPRLSQIWLACRDREVLGLCGLLAYGDESEVEPLVVAPEHRNHGIGALLTERAVAHSRSLGVQFVNVRPVARNIEALRFFRRQGFSLLGRVELSIRLSGDATASSGPTLELHGLPLDY